MPNRPSDGGDMAALCAVLADVRSALAHGDYAALGALVTQQEGLVARLGADGPGGPATLAPGDLQAILRAANRNRRLLRATMQGIRSAQRREREIAEDDGQGRFYDRNGRRETLEPPPPALERRR